MNFSAYDILVGNEILKRHPELQDTISVRSDTLTDGMFEIIDVNKVSTRASNRPIKRSIDHADTRTVIDEQSDSHNPAATTGEQKDAFISTPSLTRQVNEQTAGCFDISNVHTDPASSCEQNTRPESPVNASPIDECSSNDVDELDEVNRLLSPTRQIELNILYSNSLAITPLESRSKTMNHCNTSGL